MSVEMISLVTPITFISVNIDSDVPFYVSPLRFMMMGAWMGLPFLT